MSTSFELSKRVSTAKGFLGFKTNITKKKGSKLRFINRKIYDGLVNKYYNK